MNKLLRTSFVSGILFSAFMFAHAQAVPIRDQQVVEKITFPIAELGNCASQVECKAYCNKAENIDACTLFAVQRHLITAEERQKNQRFKEALKNGGPGGCKDSEVCKTYCVNQSHLDECTKFAQDHQLLPQTKIDQLKNFAKTFKDKGGPGGCKSAEECKTYCSATEHQAECADFGQSHGLIKPEDATILKKFKSLQDSGQTPGGCKTKDACESYCQDQSHQKECLDFAVKMGFVNKDQAQKIQATGGKGPGGCDGLDACEAYCKNQDHHEECLSFAKEHGLMKEGEIQHFRDKEVKQGENSAGGGSTFDGNNHNGNPQTPPGKLESGQHEQGGMLGCITKILGEDVVRKLDTRNLTPVAKAAIEKCRLKNVEAQKSNQAGQNQDKPKLPVGPYAGDSEKIKACLTQKLGADGIKKLAHPTERGSSEIQAILKDCGYPQHPKTDQHNSSQAGQNQSQLKMGPGSQQEPGKNPPPSPQKNGDESQNKPFNPPMSGQDGGQNPPPPQQQQPPPSPHNNEPSYEYGGPR